MINFKKAMQSLVAFVLVLALMLAMVLALPLSLAEDNTTQASQTPLSLVSESIDFTPQNAYEQYLVDYYTRESKGEYSFARITNPNAVGLAMRVKPFNESTLGKKMVYFLFNGTLVALRNPSVFGDRKTTYLKPTKELMPIVELSSPIMGYEGGVEFKHLNFNASMQSTKVKGVASSNARLFQREDGDTYSLAKLKPGQEVQVLGIDRRSFKWGEKSKWLYLVTTPTFWGYVPMGDLHLVP